MEESLEIYFCEICNESVPAQDIASKTALQVKGKVIGQCCLADVRGPQAKGGSSSAGLTALGAVLLAGLAAATIHLEWRLSEDAVALTEKVQEVNSSVDHQGDLWNGLEKRLDDTLGKDGLAPLEDRLLKLEEKLVQGQELLVGQVRASGARFAGLEETQRRLVDGQAAMGGGIKSLESEVLRLGRDLTTVLAEVRASAAGRSEGPAPAVAPRAVEEDGAGLSAQLQKLIGQLKDGDAGNRFEAVDQLIQSKDARVLEHLLPMLKDPDAFVRRLTAEGLTDFRDKSSVDALLSALADPESIVRHTAHASLKKLTGQGIAFDPDGSASARSQAKKRWQDWWRKNRDKF